MSKRINVLFLFDIYIAILKIENVGARFSSSEELLHDYVSWDSVIREFEIIGEAAKQLLKADMLDENSRVVVDFRNLLIHHYFGIDAEEVWNVIEDDLVLFKNMIEVRIDMIDVLLKKEIIESLIDDVVDNLEKQISEELT